MASVAQAPQNSLEAVTRRTIPANRVREGQRPVVVERVVENHIGIGDVLLRLNVAVLAVFPGGQPVDDFHVGIRRTGRSGEEGVLLARGTCSGTETR